MLALKPLICYTKMVQRKNTSCSERFLSREKDVELVDDIRILIKTIYQITFIRRRKSPFETVTVSYIKSAKFSSLKSSHFQFSDTVRDVIGRRKWQCIGPTLRKENNSIDCLRHAVESTTPRWPTSGSPQEHKMWNSRGVFREVLKGVVTHFSKTMNNGA